MVSRRNALKSAGLGTLLAGAEPGAMAAVNKGAAPATAPATATWARGVEGRRKADLGKAATSIPSSPPTTPIHRSWAMATITT